jgi:HK97 gp10 family phage protein
VLTGTWQGFDVAAAALKQLVNDVARDEVIAAAMIKAAKPAVLDMRSAAVRRPPAPDMADAMAVGYSPEESGTGDVAVKIGPRRAHKHGFLWRFHELGTSKMAAHPVMRPVWDAHQGAFTQRFISAITPEFVRALRRAMEFAKRQKANRTPFQRMKKAKTKAEFMAALNDWAPGGGQ